MLTSAQALIVALFGGVGTMWGAPIGAAILIPLSGTLQAQLGDVIPGIQGVVFGLAIILVVLLAPEGIFWRVRDHLHRARPASAAPIAVEHLDVMAGLISGALRQELFGPHPKKFLSLGAAAIVRH